MATSPHGRIVLITGASSGIGAEAARLFAQNGHTVYGASRRGVMPAMPPDTAAAGMLHAIYMDVSNDASVQDGVSYILQKEGRLDILIHAAGNGLAGPVETSSAQDAYAQMDVNYFGALRLLNAVLPSMRAHKSGLILLVGSVGGEFSLPFQTLYSSSKAALASLCDGLRLELRPFHVHAALIEPGDVRTGFTDSRRPVSMACPDAYQNAMHRAVSHMEKDEKNGMPPAKVAKVLYTAASRKNPRPRFVVGGLYRLFVFLKRLLPCNLVEKLLYMMYLR